MTTENGMQACCGSCKRFESEGVDGSGYCAKNDEVVECGDYCGFWREYEELR